MPTNDPAKKAAHNRAYYERHGAAVIRERKRIHQQRNVDYINGVKAAPCADCGVQYPPCVMDFDHVGDDKTDDVGKMARVPVSLERLIAEVAKCEVVCANCHRLRTYNRRLAPLR